MFNLADSSKHMLLEVLLDLGNPKFKTRCAVTLTGRCCSAFVTAFMGKSSSVQPFHSNYTSFNYSLGVPNTSCITFSGRTAKLVTTSKHACLELNPASRYDKVTLSLFRVVFSASCVLTWFKVHSKFDIVIFY